MDTSNNDFYIDKLCKIINNFINNKLDNELDYIEVNLFLRNALDNNTHYEKIINLIDIIGGDSDYLRITNTTTEIIETCKKFTNKVNSYFEERMNSVNITELQKEIERQKNYEDYDNIDEYSIEDQAYDVMLELTKMIISLNSKRRYEGIKKFEEIARIIGKEDDERFEINEYMFFQEALQDILMTNIFKYGKYDINSHSPINNNQEEGMDYFDLSKDYIEYLIREKVNIFSRKGRVLKNYIALLKIKPELDKYGFFKKINDSYNLDNIDIDEEYKYLDKIINNNELYYEEGDIDFEKLNDFLSHLQLIKLKSKDFIIPKKYVDIFIKKQLEDSNLNYGIMCPFMETIIEDFGKFDLQSQIDNPEEYLYYVSDNVQGSNLNTYGRGATSERGVVLNREFIKQFMNTNLTILDTIFHENTHISQMEDFKKKEINDYKRYIMEKEKSLYELYPNIYSDNYYQIFEEIEANNTAIEKTIKYINELNPSNKDSVLNNRFNYDNQKPIGMFFRKNLLFKGQKINFNAFFDVIIKEHPELLEKYPHLKLEYNPNGDKKNLREIINNGITQKVFTVMMITYGDIMNIDTFSDDIDFLIELSKNEKNNFIITQLLKMNTKNIVQSAIDTIDIMEPERLKNVKETINKIKFQIDQNLVFKNGMTEQDFGSRGMKGIDFINLLEDKINKRLIEISEKPEETLIQDSIIEERED